MARITLNVAQEKYDDATGGGFEPIPPGKYTAEVFSVEDKECQSPANKGKPQMNVQFKIVEGQPHANRRVFKLFNLFGDNPFDAINFLKALGIPYDSSTGFDFDTDDLHGETLQITVAHEEKKTKESKYKESFNPPQFREKITSYRSLDSVEVSTTAKTNAGGKATGGKRFTL